LKSITVPALSFRTSAIKYPHLLEYHWDDRFDVQTGGRGV